LAAASAGRATGVERGVAPGADATRELYERYSGQIFGYCLHRLGTREEAEDAVQSTFLNAFRGLARGVVPESESAWLFKIAENVCHSRHRSSWRRGRVESPSDLDAFQDVLPAPSRAQDELIPLGEALERLPETQRRAILLREWQGLSYREISEELALSQSAVETLIFRARRSLVDGLEAPLRPRRRRTLRRVGHGLDVGGLVAGLKMLLGGGGPVAVKAAAVAVALTGATVAVGHRHHAVPAPARPAVQPAARADVSPPSSVVRPRTVAPPTRKLTRRSWARPVAPSASPPAAVRRARAPRVVRPVQAAPAATHVRPAAPPPTRATTGTLEQETPPVVVPDPPPAPATTTNEEPAPETSTDEPTSILTTTTAPTTTETVADEEPPPPSE
jgi:RNA polymerase sigma factor (sigma-70 family)